VTVITMTNQSARLVRNLILDRLTTGVYPLGSKLPTARELAFELGVHRNTAAKAYQMLAELGLVTTQQGRGTFVVGTPYESNGKPLTAEVLDNLAAVVLQARRVGVPEHALREAFGAQIDTAYRSSGHGVYVECNRGDIEMGIAEIELMTGVRLAPLHLDLLQTDAAGAVDGYNVVFTSLIHSKEVSELLGPVRPDLRIVGLYTQPDEDAMAQIAQIRPGSRVGIVVDIPDGARRFENQINTVTSVETRALVMPSDEEIRALAQVVGPIVCSSSRAPQVRALSLANPIIDLKFHISRQSANRVIEVISAPLVSR
jgi:DNA-binding transcriptional regulator YhcF (GntR family)